MIVSLESSNPEKIAQAFEQFCAALSPDESKGELLLFKDERTNAFYCECHIKASAIVRLATIVVPLDPDEQADYKANRDIIQNHYAFKVMQDDAKKKRTFSNIVVEFNKDFEPDFPIKIIGGQHRYTAIKEALEFGIDQYHGLKIYLDLNKEQRLDVQLISNTAITISSDLFDRMQETVKGPQLRKWCQEAGLLAGETDFADKRVRGGPISVQIARTFISNYYAGTKIAIDKFDSSETSPMLCPSGQHDNDWDSLTAAHPILYDDLKLKNAAIQFSNLVKAQRESFNGTSAKKGPPDFPEKALNMAVLSAWAFTAGLLGENQTRLTRHFSLSGTKGRDPLNAAELAKGKHKTDPENYRGLGYRTDAKERARLTELFYLQAENGDGITKSSIDIAIKKYHAKQAQLEVIKAQDKG